MSAPSEQGKALYGIVPAVYRNRDTGDLERYLQGCGVLLDQVYATLVQRLADAFPDNPEAGAEGCQEWLLPYFADLLDVRLVSPSLRGRREEIANAIAWRQGKGTLRVVEQIAEAIAQLEVVVQEGWQRVARTPRLNRPQLPASVYGYAGDCPDHPPPTAARHPALPAATVDFRCRSGAVAAASANAAARQSTVDRDTHTWRQSSLHGAPCSPDSYEDVSPRTVDFRRGDWRRGHYHPRRVLLYSVPSAGLFPPEAPGVLWSDPPSAAFADAIEVIVDEAAGRTTFRNRSLDTERFQPVRIRRVVRLGQEDDGVGPADAHTWRFEGLILENTVQLDSGRIELERCAARKVEVHSIDASEPVIAARGCVFRELQAARGLSRLEYCTVLGQTLSETLEASDCIFLGPLRKDHTGSEPPSGGCLRYSALPPAQSAGGLRLAEGTLTREAPVFTSAAFGERGCAVLHPAAPRSIAAGAEDGGEMGAYHDDHISLLREAVVDKLRDYLPVGLEAIVIPDPRLLDMPG